jgi:hypothetical protein
MDIVPVQVTAAITRKDSMLLAEIMLPVKVLHLTEAPIRRSIKQWR